MSHYAKKWNIGILKLKQKQNKYERTGERTWKTQGTNTCLIFGLFFWNIDLVSLQFSPTGAKTTKKEKRPWINEKLKEREKWKNAKMKKHNKNEWKRVVKCEKIWRKMKKWKMAKWKYGRSKFRALIDCEARQEPNTNKNTKVKTQGGGGLKTMKRRI